MTKTILYKKLVAAFCMAAFASGCTKASLKKIGPVATAPGSQPQVTPGQMPAGGSYDQPPVPPIVVQPNQPQIPIDVIQVPAPSVPVDEITPERRRGSRTVLVDDTSSEIQPIDAQNSGVVTAPSTVTGGCPQSCGTHTPQIIPQQPAQPTRPAMPPVQAPAPTNVVQPQPAVVPAPLVPQPAQSIVVTPRPTQPAVVQQPKCVEETFEQNAGQNNLDILIVSETRILGNVMGQKVGDAIASKLIKSYQDRCSDLGQYSSIRVGFLPGVSKRSPLHGKLAEIKYKLVDRDKQQFVLESEKLKTEQLATSIRMNFSFNAPQDAVVSGHPIPGGNAGLAALDSLLNDNLQSAKSQGFFRENAALHIIFISSRADMCATNAQMDLGGSQNEVLRAETCAQFNMTHLVQSLQKVVPSSKLVTTAIVGVPGQKNLEVTQTQSGQPLMYKPGLGFGYTDLVNELKGQVVDFEKPELMLQTFSNIRYNLDGGQTTIETFFDTKFSPLPGTSSVWAVEPFDPRQSVLAKCRDLTTADAKCINTKKTVCSLGSPGCSLQSGMVSKEFSGARQGVQVLGGYFLPKSKVHVKYCYAWAK